MTRKTLLKASVLGMGAFAIVATAFPTIAQNAESPSSQRLLKKDIGKMSGSLLKLHDEYQAYQEQKSVKKSSAVFNPSDTKMNIVAETVVIDAASDDPNALASDLKDLGAEDVTVFGHMVSGRLPISAIPALNDLSSLKLVRPSYVTKHSGLATTQGDKAMRSDLARTALGVDGTGVKVGTLSDSYDCLGGAATGVSNGDLPIGVTVLQEGPCPASDEGRAMMEIIHDVAPGAELSFRSAFIGGEAGFAQGILDLATLGATVINDDISYGTEPFYQDGVISQAIDTVAAQGVSYFTSTGNAGRRAYESLFRPSGLTVDFGNGPQVAHDFDPNAGVDICQQVDIPTGASLTISFQWDQPFFSISGAPGSMSDLDILLYDAACDTSQPPLAFSANNNLGADPLEFMGFQNTSSATKFNIVIVHFGGPTPGLMKTIATSENLTYDEFDTQTGASYGHPLAVGASGVGAAWYMETPEFGQTPPLIEASSSAGGSPILFDTAGNRLAIPDIRQNPTITAPDGGDTSFFGGEDPEGNGLPNFFGTSAAAPHAAAVAALMNERVPGITPAAINTALQDTAIDMDDPSTIGFDTGADFGTGFGLIQADAALNAIAPQAISGDFDMDGDVDLNDLIILRGMFGNTVQSGSPFDMNNDGTINVLDYRLLITKCTRTRCAIQ